MTDDDLGRSFIGFFELLQITFIVLKLCNVIDWSWLWVLAPIWIPLAAFILIAIIIAVCARLPVRRSDTEIQGDNK